MDNDYDKHAVNVLEKAPSSTNSPEGQTRNIDPALDKRITKRFDRHILPWIFGIWLLAFIDRSNIGNAKLDGLLTDLNLDGTKFNTSLAVFYILYILYDIPSNLVLKRIGGGRYIPALVILWGIITTCLGATKSYAGLLVCRLLLGLCEGGLFGGVILYLGMFYPRHKLLTRIGIFYCAAPLSGSIGGLLAAGLSRIRYNGYNGWPWIFFIEGAITIVVGITALFFLPDTPGSARFLTTEERAAATYRLVHDSNGATTSAEVEDEEFSWKYLKPAILNINTMLMSLLFICVLVPIYSYSLFLPTIISGLGYTSVVAQLFTVPPNFLGFLSVLFSCWLSDRIKMRGPIMIGGACIGIIGYAMLLGSTRPGVRYAGTFFVAAGIYPTSPTVLAWLSNNLAPHYVRAAGIGFQVAIGNCASFVATFSYLPADSPRYVVGNGINLAFLGVIVILTFVTMGYISRENRIRENGGRDGRLTEGDESQLGYRHPNFRYTS